MSKGVPFKGFVHIAPYLWDQISQTHILGHELAFSSQTGIKIKIGVISKWQIMISTKFDEQCWSQNSLCW